MEFQDINELRKQIREILLKKEKAGEFAKKTDINSLKKDCYTKLVDLKNSIEGEETNPEKILDYIEMLTPAINQLKNSLNKELKG